MSKVSGTLYRLAFSWRASGIRIYEEAGQLANLAPRTACSIVVFDEVKRIQYCMLLQIMEEVTPLRCERRKVDFRNAIIVMTINIGADVIKKQSSLGFALKTR
ncbi:MAG: AAA family ATPase [Anaerolineales bacterium]